MKAHVEMVTGVIRAGPEFKNFGDPYEFACTIIVSGSTCEIRGASGKFTMATYRAVKEALEAIGITEAHWERARGKHVIAKGSGVK